MRKIIIFAFSLSVLLFGAIDDNPLIVKTSIEKLEMQYDEDNEKSVDVDLSIMFMKDVNKISISSELEHDLNEDLEMNVQFQYIRALDTFWDMKLGIRKDIFPLDESKEWLSAGVSGLAPYFLDTTAMLYVDKNSNILLELELEYELMFTQKIVMDVDFDGKLNKDTNSDEVASSFLASFRLGYEVKKNIAPYIGMAYGVAEGKSSKKVLAGFRIWM